MGTGYGLANRINQIFDKHQLRLVKILRLGPRFFIALCEKGKTKYVLKINLYERYLNQDTRTHNEHLAREASFLKFIQAQKDFSLLKNGVPKIYDYDLTGQQTWYLKDYTTGNFQNYQQSNFLFKGSFFTQENLNWIIKFFAELHRLSQKLTKKQRGIFHRHQLNDYLKLINGQCIKKIFGPKLKNIYHFFQKYEKIFNQNQTALTHFEPYPVHFIKTKESLKIIDWENIGWGNSAHDIAVIWLRAYEKKNWQKILRKKFPLSTPLKNNWEELFKVEIVVQSLANLPYLMGTTDLNEKRVAPKISQFLKEQSDLILANKF